MMVSLIAKYTCLRQRFGSLAFSSEYLDSYPFTISKF